MRAVFWLLLCLAGVGRAERAHGCRFNLQQYKPRETRDFFFCDKTTRKLHAISRGGGGGSEWMEAAPKLGSGCHEYAAFAGAPPKRCKVGKRCAACAKPNAKHLTSVYLVNHGIHNGGCGGCGPTKGEAPAPPPPVLEEEEDDDEDRDLWGLAEERKPLGLDGMETFDLKHGWKSGEAAKDAQATWRSTAPVKEEAYRKAIRESNDLKEASEQDWQSAPWSGAAGKDAAAKEDL